MRNPAIVIALFLISTLTIGCGSAPKKVTLELDVDTPAEWTGAPSPAGPVPAGWWSDFASPALDSLVATAVERNHDLKVAAAALDAAAAQARIAGADVWPTLDMSYSGARSKRNFVGFPIPGGDEEVLSTTNNSHGLSFGSSWELDLWGRVRSGKSAALAEFEAVEAEFAGARLSLAGQVAKAYFAVVESRLQLDLAAASAESYRSSAASVRKRFELGIRSSLDLRLALTSLGNAEAVYEIRRQQYDGAVRRLETMLGYYPSGESVAEADLPPVPPAVPAGLPAELLARRPDLVAAERRLASSGAYVHQAKASLLPRISLTGSAGRSSEEIEDLLKGDFGIWSLAGNIVLPIFQGGKLRAGVDLAEARQSQAVASYAGSALRAFAEVESALAAEEMLAAREDALRRSAEQAVAARALAEDRYRSGLADIITLLESQRQAFLSEIEVLSIRRTRLEARVDLYLALGGGFAEPDTTMEISRAPETGQATEVENR